MKAVKSDVAGLEAAAAALLSGGVAVVPTDTVYGLAAHPGFPDAVRRLYTIKERAAAKPIALLASGADAAERFLGGMDAQARRLAEPSLVCLDDLHRSPRRAPVMSRCGPGPRRCCAGSARPCPESR